MQGLDINGLIEFFKDIEDNGMYLHQSPFWNNIKFDDLKNILDKFDWIKPYECYYMKDGKEEKIKNNLIIGSAY